LDYSKYVKSEQTLYRPAEVDILLGDASLAKKVLGWEHTIGFQQLVFEMVDREIQRLTSIADEQASAKSQVNIV
jgi:GDPmannose 4,6-dehydratase